MLGEVLESSLWGGLAPGPEPLFLLLAALAIDAALGLLPGRGRSLARIDRLVLGVVGWFEPRLNRIQRSGMTRAVRGLILTLILVAAALLAAGAIAWAGHALPFGWLLVLALLLLVLAQSQPLAAAGVLLPYLPDAVGKFPAHREWPLLAAYPAPPILTRDVYAAARGAVEHLAGRFAEGVVGPVFWFVLLGLPGLLIYRILATAGRAFGHTDPRYAYFGFVPARVNEAFGFLPLRLAAALLVVAALFAPRARPQRALRCVLAQAPGHPARGLAWPVASMAGAFGFALAGPRGETTGYAWLGPADGRARLGAPDVRQARYLVVVGCLLNGLVVALIALARATL